MTTQSYVIYSPTGDIFAVINTNDLEMVKFSTPDGYFYTTTTERDVGKLKRVDPNTKAVVMRVMPDKSPFN